MGLDCKSEHCSKWVRIVHEGVGRVLVETMLFGVGLGWAKHEPDLTRYHAIKIN